ncbi:MAG: F0F1 ATP synthase subunit B, partial [Bacteroidota bacterium]
GNPLLNPDTGLFIWTAAIFCIFWFLVYRMAGGAIKDGLATRNAEIQDALDEAEKAKVEMANLKAENEKMIAKAKADRAQIIADAKAAKDKIVADAKERATEEASRIIANAKLEIENQKKSAINDVKNESGLIALAIAERVIKQQLKSQDEQNNLTNGLIKDIKLN